VPPDHFAASDLAEFLPPDIDFAFAVVRHPVWRMVSEYRYQRASSKLSLLSFSTWLRVVVQCAKLEPRMYENHIRPQSDLVPDFAKTFRIEDGIDAIIRHIDEVVQESVPQIDLPHLNQSHKSNVSLSKEDVLTIQDFYAADYRRFGYEFLDTSQLADDPYAKIRVSFARALAPIAVAVHKRAWTK
jgi:hypothetical protein